MAEIHNNNKKTIVYIGDFDFKNENVQSRLVRNNSKIFNKLGYDVFFIGVDRLCTDFRHIKSIAPVDNYLELPNTLSLKGVFKCRAICQKVLRQLDETNHKSKITHVITYQAPTFAVVLKRVAIWCKVNNIKYVVNSADIPIFDAQPFLRRLVMKINWKMIHRYNDKYADGIIAVSSHIKSFYKKNNRKSIVVPPLFEKNNYINCSESRNEVTSFVYAGTPFIKTTGPIDPKGMKDRLDVIVDLFIGLASKGIDYKLTVIGVELNEYATAIPRHKTILENNDHIVFLGRRDHNKTLEMIANSDFSINYRDINEMTEAGFSTKIVESISLGTPVITNKTSDIGFYLRKNIEWFELKRDADKNVELLSFLSLLPQSERRDLKDKCFLNNSFCLDSYVDLVKDFLTN